MNFDSPEWKEVTQRIDKEIAMLDEQNRSVKLGADQTASIRGQIAALLRLKEWPKSANQTVEDEVNFGI